MRKTLESIQSEMDAIDKQHRAMKIPFADWDMASKLRYGQLRSLKRRRLEADKKEKAKLKENMKVTKEQLLAWLGDDATKDTVVTLLLEVANGEYKADELLKDVNDYDGHFDEVHCLKCDNVWAEYKYLKVCPNCLNQDTEKTVYLTKGAEE